MEFARSAAAVLLAAACGLAGCGDRPADPPAGDTAVLGGYAPGAARGNAPLADARGQPIPRPDMAPLDAQVVRSGELAALAVWVQDGQVVASSFERARGWSAPQPLEQIYGQASDPQVASNGQGAAMAVWRHTVGSIQSLRFSRFDPAAGWSRPDVLPGALPRPPGEAGAGDRDAPQLRMEPDGSVTAQWPSGFAAAEMQTARYTPGQGWSRAASEPMAVAPPAPAASGPTASR